VTASYPRTTVLRDPQHGGKPTSHSTGCISGVNYADDFVILSRGYAEEALAWTRQVMTKLGLTVNETKTAVRNARQEHFDFLGYSFGPHYYRKDGHWYLGVSPSRKSVQRLKAADAMVATGRRSAAPGPLRRLQRHTRCRVWTSI
jgi:RNA-directed DNA polymerase